jgi:hypothetical protein
LNVAAACETHNPDVAPVPASALGAAGLYAPAEAVERVVGAERVNDIETLGFISLASARV